MTKQALMVNKKFVCMKFTLYLTVGLNYMLYYGLWNVTILEKYYTHIPLATKVLSLYMHYSHCQDHSLQSILGRVFTNYTATP